MTIYYADLSNNNWHSTQEAISFLEQQVAEGFSAVCHKVAEGNYYRDPYWTPVLDWCKRNDLLCIGYQYVTTNSPRAQALTYLSNVGDPSVPCMLDFEANSGDINNFWAVVNAFNVAGVQIALSYIPHWYWQQIGQPDISAAPGLVASSYVGGFGYASSLYESGGGDDGVGWNGYGGATPAVWQFTDKATIAGINVDCNAFRGSLDDFKQLLGIITPTPSPGGPPVTTPNPPAIPRPVSIADQSGQIWDQLLTRWDMLAGHTPVEALAVIGNKLGIDGFNPPEGN